MVSTLGPTVAPGLAWVGELILASELPLGTSPSFVLRFRLGFGPVYKEQAEVLSNHLQLEQLLWKAPRKTRQVRNGPRAFLARRSEH